MFQKFNEEAKKVIKKAKLEMQELKHPFVGSEHFILSILSQKNLNITEKLNNLGINYQNFHEELIKTLGIGCSLNTYFIYTPLLKRIIENAIVESREEGSLEVTLNHLFLSLLDEGEGVAIRIFSNLGVDSEKIYSEFQNEETKKKKSKKKLSLYEFGIDLCQKASEGKIDPVIGRDMEINRLIEVLSRRNKNNPLLLGEAGVGKTAIIENLALKIVKKEVPYNLINKKIISISMANLVAGTKYRGEFEERIQKLIKEVENNPNIIIFIDEIHSIVGAGGAEGAIDASNILKPALARGNFKLIGATTLKEYKESIEKDKALSRRFQPILIEEPTIEETIHILLNIKELYENYHQVLITDDNIKDIARLSNKYIHNRKNPDKSIDILDEVCASVSIVKDKNQKKIEELKEEFSKIVDLKNKLIIKHNFEEASNLKNKEIEIENKINTLSLKQNKVLKRTISKEDIAKIIKLKTNVPIYEISKTDLKSLQEIESKLKKEIIGQENAIIKLCQETKKVKLGLKRNNKPISFLFTGKTGVGKTELVKKYAEFLNMNLIRLDMSEYRESHTTSKILGSPPGYVGYNDHNSILEQVKNYPFSVILLDEIEKCSSSVLNLFLQILDEGILTNSIGEKIYFNHTIIIMTSNITAKNSSIGFNENKESSINQKLENVLSIEFINRINHIIQFEELTRENIELIIHKEINEIKKQFKKQNIKLKVSNDVIDEIIRLSNYKVNGARKVKKLLEEKIDNLIIENLLSGNTNVNIVSIL